MGLMRDLALLILFIAAIYIFLDLTVFDNVHPIKKEWGDFTIGDIKTRVSGMISKITGNEEPPSCVVKIYENDSLIDEYEDAEACT